MLRYPTIRKTATFPQLSNGLWTPGERLAVLAADFTKVLIFHPVPGLLAPVLPDEWVVIRNEMRLPQNAPNLRSKHLGIRVEAMELDLNVLAHRNESRFQHPAQQRI